MTVWKDLTESKPAGDFASHALRLGAGVAVHLSKIRPDGTDNGKGLIASGPCPLGKVYSCLNEQSTEEVVVYKNGAVVLHLDIKSSLTSLSLSICLGMKSLGQSVASTYPLLCGIWLTLSCERSNPQRHCAWRHLACQNQKRSKRRTHLFECVLGSILQEQVGTCLLENI